MKSPDTGLKSNTKTAMIDLLNARLADAIDLALVTKQAHWNLKGPTFIAVHELLDELRDDIDEHVDIIAERVAQLDGVDVISFTAGVGENSPRVRAGAVATLGFAGVELDPERNERRERGIRVISTDASPVTVLVVPTNEELEIAQQTLEVAAG